MQTVVPPQQLNWEGVPKQPKTWKHPKLRLVDANGVDSYAYYYSLPQRMKLQKPLTTKKKARVSVHCCFPKFPDDPSVDSTTRRTKPWNTSA
jgi:hypothetical protein